MAVRVFGIPACDSVKKARNWLDKAAIAYEFIDIRTPPIADEVVANWYTEIGSALVNTRSTTYRQLTSDEQNELKSGNCLPLLQRYPTLIKRPVLQVNNQFFCGFDAAHYQTLFAN
ncbi:MAG TPA: Spx/MgsR family RNA polymerase-binding regulatory protein [Cellvibrionaceae bacterium]